MRGGNPLALDDTYLWIVLLIAAYIDFVHDFNDSSRTAISVDLLKGDPYGVVPPRDKFKGIEDLLAKAGGRSATAFHAFKDIVSAILLRLIPDPKGIPRALQSNVDSIREQAILHETDILDLIQLEYKTFISGLPPDIPPPTPGTSVDARRQITVPGRDPGKLTVSFGEGAVARSIEYIATSYPTKLRGENKAHVHTAEAFHGVSGGRNVFVCMIDAASCSMDIIGDPWTFTPAQQAKGNTNHLSYLGQPYHSARDYHFFILNSKENISDPAGKSTIRNRVLPLKVDPNQKNVFVYFLEEADPNHVSVFPTGTENIEDPVQKANQSAFTPFTVDTRRTGTVDAPTVSAIARTTAGTFTMSDVGTDSEVRSAAQRAVTQTLLKSPAEEVFLNFMMKRFGDWCQALCLRDTTRRYKVVKVNSSSTPDARFNPLYKEDDVVSLDDLQTIHKALIFLLTIDRVLLAFALALGINVIFTSKSGVIGTSWMTLFETGVARKDVSDAADLYENLPFLDEDVKRQIEYVQSIIERLPVIQEPIVRTNFGQYPARLIELRDTLSELSFLPTISTLNKHLIRVTEDHDTTENPEENKKLSFLYAFTPFFIDSDGKEFGSIPTDINEVALDIPDRPDEQKRQRDIYQKTVNEFRTFVETVRKNQALIDSSKKRLGGYSAERMREGANIEKFFATLTDSPDAISSRHPLFKSVEQTLQSIVSDARLVGVKLSPLGDVSTAWDAAATAAGRRVQFVPRQSGRAGAIIQRPLQELFSAYQIASNPVPAGLQGGQRGGGDIKSVFESPVTEMVYVIGLPLKPVPLQDDDIERGPAIQALIPAKQAEAADLLRQLAGVTGDATQMTNNRLYEVTAELMSEVVRTGVYGGKIGNDQGHLASVIDPYVFFGGKYLTLFLTDDNMEQPDPIHVKYMALRYLLWKTDELYSEIEKLKSGTPENDADLSAYDSIANDLDTLSSIISIVDTPKPQAEGAEPEEFAIADDDEEESFEDAVKSFIRNGSSQDSDIRSILEELAPFKRPVLIDGFISATFSDDANAIRTSWNTQVKPFLDSRVPTINGALLALGEAKNEMNLAAKAGNREGAAAAMAKAQQIDAYITAANNEYYGILEQFVKQAETVRPGVTDELRLYGKTAAFNDRIQSDEGLVAQLREVREAIYRVYEGLDIKYRAIAYPQQGAPAPAGGVRRKTHRRRLPKLV
jgi:hypothetical protein